MYLPILHLPRVELHCKLQEKLCRVTASIAVKSVRVCNISILKLNLVSSISVVYCQSCFNTDNVLAVQ